MNHLSSRNPPWLTVGILLGLAAALALSFLSKTSPPTFRRAPPARPPELQVRIKSHLDWADRESQQAVQRQLDHLRRFFQQARQQAPDFAREALGWGSKWRLLTDHVLWIGTKKAHERFLKECFAKHLFSPEDLEQVLRRVVIGFEEDLRGIEGQLLIKLRLDVADLPNSQQLLENLTQAKLEPALLPAQQAAVEAAGSELRAEAVRGVISLVVSEVLAQTAVRGGLSAGVLGSGASSSLVTFGIGLAIGVIVDQLVSWIWDWICDPQGQLVRRLEAWLDELHRLLVEGDGSSPGLRQRLEELARDRAAARRTAILELLGQR